MTAGTATRLGAALLLATTTASGRAQDAAQEGGGGAPREPADLASACIALLRGEPAAGLDADAVRPRCEAMILEASAAPQPGVGREPATAGPQVRAAFEQAGRELVGRGGGPRLGLGATTHGDARSLLTTNPIGWFSGLGVNAEFSRAIDAYPKTSWIAAARYSRANATNGEVTSVGLGTGLDFFVVGRNNEGLRVGPRLDFSFGTEDFGGTTTFARLGLSGELGYNFIARNGLSALAAVGLGGRLAGDEQNEDFTSFTGGELGPYLKVGLGYAF